MSVEHHIPDEWIAAWSAGTLDEARELLVAVHLTFCPLCREKAALADTAASAALTSADDVAIEEAGLEAVLGQLDTPVPEGVSPSTEWPRPLAPFVHDRWTWLAPNTWGIDLPHPTDGELPLRLVWMRAGASLPHAHRGEEAAVVLRGGWTDQHGHFGPGDLYHSDDRDAHAQQIDAGEPCIALVLNEKKAGVAGLLGVFSWLFRT